MDRLSALAAKKIPFFFVISYDQSEVYVEPLESLPKGIFFKTPLLRNYHPPAKYYPAITSKKPIDYDRYKAAFDLVQKNIRAGNTYLLNLTFPTPIELSHTLLETFLGTKAKFKLYFKDRFICFSPERFVSIDENGTIRTYPMKGTIDAAIPNAKSKILSDPKEMAEHTMVVDLLRNDLGMVSRRVRVKRFRYVDKILAGSRELLQVSSEIEAELGGGWRERLGDIIAAMLPAGSVTGAPKRSTCRIIAEAEGYERGFYTGIFGVFDGKRLDSGVMIRFIERVEAGYLYKSGGGITIDSDPQKEYAELLEKIYLPI
jgi:para-aminobenzoate synthetase component 1